MKKTTYIFVCYSQMVKFELPEESSCWLLSFRSNCNYWIFCAAVIFLPALMLISLNPLKHSVHKADCVSAPYTTLQTCPLPGIATTPLISLKGW